MRKIRFKLTDGIISLYTASTAHSTCVFVSVNNAFKCSAFPPPPEAMRGTDTVAKGREILVARYIFCHILAIQLGMSHLTGYAAVRAADALDMINYFLDINALLYAE